MFKRYAVTVLIYGKSNKPEMLEYETNVRLRAYAKFNDWTYLDSPDLIIESPYVYSIMVTRQDLTKRGFIPHLIAHADIDANNGIPSTIKRHYL